MSNELATREDRGIVAILLRPETRDELLKVIPPDCNVDTLISRAKAAVLANPDLRACSPQSVLLAVKKSVSCGLELDGRNSHLVPYKGKDGAPGTCQFIVDFKGYIALALRCGITGIKADIICERDTFRHWTDDEGQHFKHEANVREPRGRVVGAFCQTFNQHGRMDVEVMSVEDIKAVQARSKAKFGPWSTDWNEMAKKTVVRRMQKRWDIDTRFKRALELDDDAAEREPVQKVALILPGDEKPETPQLNAAELPEELSGKVSDLNPATGEFEWSGDK